MEILLFYVVFPDLIFYQEIYHSIAIITIKGKTANGDWGQIEFETASGSVLNQHPPFVSFNHGGDENAVEFADSCYDMGAPDCTNTLIKNHEFKVQFNDQVVSNPVDNTTSTIRGEIRYTY